LVCQESGRTNVKGHKRPVRKVGGAWQKNMAQGRDHQEEKGGKTGHMSRISSPERQFWGERNIRGEKKLADRFLGATGGNRGRYRNAGTIEKTGRELRQGRKNGEQW